MSKTTMPCGVLGHFVWCRCRCEAPSKGNRDERRRARTETWFAIGNTSEHSGFITSRVAADIWTSSNDAGWTYQDVCSPHGTVLREGTEEECRAQLDTWLVCDDGRCYTHGAT